VNTALMYDSALAGLQAAQAGMVVTSQNVAGAQVAGYVRRSSNVQISTLSPSSTEAMGASFSVEGFTRNFSSLLQGQLLTQISKTSYTTVLTRSVSVLDSMLVEPSASISAALGSFFNAAGSLANEPGNQAYQQSLVGAAAQVGDRIRGLAEAVAQIDTNARQALADVLNQANTLAPQLASINAKIKGAAVPGVAYPSPDLLDERDRITASLQDLVGGSTTINDDGTASYSVQGLMLVDGQKANQFTSVNGATPVTPDQFPWGVRLKVSPYAGKAPTLLRLGVPTTPVNDGETGGIKQIDLAQNAFTDGQAGGYFQLIQHFVPNLQRSLNLLGMELMGKVNSLQSSTATDSNGNPLGIVSLFGFSAVNGNPDVTDLKAISAAGNSYADLLKQVAWDSFIHAADPGSGNPFYSYDVRNQLEKLSAVVDAKSGYGFDRLMSLMGGGTPEGSALFSRLKDDAGFQAWWGNTAITTFQDLNARLTVDPNAQASKVTFNQLSVVSDMAYVQVIEGLKNKVSAPTLTALQADTAFQQALSQHTYGSLINAFNPSSPSYSSALVTALDNSRFDARHFKSVATFTSEQFTNFDASVANQLEGFRSFFSSPVTYITSSVAGTIATWKNDHKANEAISQVLSDQKNSISGVSLDEEAANLVKYQQLYNASSKILQSHRQMFDTLLAMLSGN
jgi:flagellar hook-associated protein FlgK